MVFLTFQIKNDGTHNCLDTMGRKSGEAVGLSYCHGLGGNQVRADQIKNLTMDSLGTTRSPGLLSYYNGQVLLNT